MSKPASSARRRAVPLVIAAAIVTALGMLPAAGAQAKPTPAAAPSTAEYVVQMAGAPLAGYTGGVAGIAATKAAPGAKPDLRGAAAQAYRQHLRELRAEVLRRAGLDAKKATTAYETAFNGFAARLTSAEVSKLSGTPGVVKVWKSRVHTAQTVHTPTFLGLDGPTGVWQRQFGDVSKAGEGMIVGVIDTGFWPENPSFGALPEPRPDQAQIDAKWFGTCVTGDNNPVTCNNKVIGARWYDDGGAGDNPAEFRSPRDRDGHGSHTASTAAGNHGVTAVVDGVTVGDISGMAPAARLAIYKVLWEQPSGQASGSDVDIVHAIDDAVADGVDVLNYSVGDDVDQVGPEDIAFINAAAAGVFISAAAGNAGPGAATVDNAAPWQITVAATTHDRDYRKTLTLGNGATYTGAGIGAGVGSSPLVDSANVGLAGADPTAAELCTPGTLDPAKVTGKIVLCKRGVVDRVAKSLAVKQAGGVGMVMYNPTPNDTVAEIHSVPSVHVDTATGTAVKAYIAGTASPTAAISQFALVPQRAPSMASFSSRGPSVSNGGDLLKPDIAAPGVNVLAAVSPAGHNGSNFDLESGTSMSAPHIAGIAALVKAKHPDWSPMQVKSALMTTATTLDNEGKPIQDAGANADPLDFGAGEVRPAPAFNPGLVYDSTPLEWLQYTCGTGVHLVVGDGSDVCDTTGSIDPSNLNYPSISVGDLVGKQTVTRTVTNVDGRASIYVARVQAPPGLSVKVTPSTMVVPAHKTVTYQVEVTRTSAAFGAWTFGSLTWNDLRGHSVRSPIAVRPVALVAPDEVTGTGVSGSAPLTVTPGFSGRLTAKPYGLVASTVGNQRLVGVETEFDPDNPVANAAVAKLAVTVPAGAKVGRVATFDADYGAGTDLDLFAYSNGTLVAASAGPTAGEHVDLPAGSYDVYLVQFALPAGVAEQNVKVHSFTVGGTAAGNLTVTPAGQAVQAGRPVTVTVGWSGLQAGAHYLGVVEYGNGGTVVGGTLVTVNP